MKFFLSTSLIFLFLLSSNVLAKSDKFGWILSPVVGINQLGLKVFYDTVYNAPFVGRVRITTDLPEDVQGESSYPTKRFHFENSLRPTRFNTEAGLELRRQFGTQTDFFVGIVAWETLARADDIEVVFPMQGQPNNLADYSRDSKLSYTQYYLGARHYFAKRSNRFNVYANFSLREIFDVDYEETNVFEFTSGAPQGFKRIFIFKSQATGFLMMQLGMGTEFSFTDRFSIAFEGAYAVHLKSGALRGVSVDNDYNDGDGFEDAPYIIAPVNPLLDAGALDEDGVSRNKVNLRFDGWHLLAKFNIEF